MSGLLAFYDFESAGTLASYGFTGDIDVGSQLNNVNGKGNGGGYGVASTSGILLGLNHGWSTTTTEGRVLFDFYPDTPFGTWMRFHDTTLGTSQVYSLELNASLSVRLLDGNAGTVFATFSGLLSRGSWAKFEIRFKEPAPSTANGTLEVSINNNVVYSNVGGWGGGVSTLLGSWNTTRWLTYNDMRYDNISVYDKFDRSSSITPPAVTQDGTCTPTSQTSNGGKGKVGCNVGGVGFISSFSGGYGAIPNHADPVLGELLTNKPALDIWVEFDL